MNVLARKWVKHVRHSEVRESRSGEGGLRPCSQSSIDVCDNKRLISMGALVEIIVVVLKMRQFPF